MTHELFVNNNITKMSGRRHGLWLTQTGLVISTGVNTHGQCGRGNETAFVSGPDFISDLNETVIVDISAGDLHSLACDSNGFVWSWGSNFNGQLGNGNLSIPSMNRPFKIPTLVGCKRVSAGNYHSLVMDSLGAVFSFGSSVNGILGIGASVSGDYPVPQKINLFGVVAMDIFAGKLRSFIVSTANSLYGFGRNQEMALGLDGVENRFVPTLNAYLSLYQVERVTGGPEHTLVMTKDNKLFGFGDVFETGVDTTFPYYVPNIPGGNYSQSAGGANHIFVLYENGDVYGFGDNLNGQLGIGTTNVMFVATKIPISNVSQMHPGGTHSLFIMHDTTLWVT